MSTTQETTIYNLATSKDLYPDYESKWQALIARDPKAARCFLYCVKSTGIFCRPTCAARLARQKNVVFFDTVSEAEEAGFRPCKRCKPLLPLHDTHHSVIRQTCKLLDSSPDSVPHLKVLAEKAGFTQWHFHRIFRRFTGITPRMYWEARHSPDKQIKKKLSNINLDELISKIAKLDENTVIDHDLIKSSYNKRPRSTSKTAKTAKKPNLESIQKKLPQIKDLSPVSDGDLFSDIPLNFSNSITSNDELPLSFDMELQKTEVLSNPLFSPVCQFQDANELQPDMSYFEFQENESYLSPEEGFGFESFFPDLHTITNEYVGTPSPPSSETFSESLALTPPFEDFAIDSFNGYNVMEGLSAVYLTQLS